MMPSGASCATHPVYPNKSASIVRSAQTSIMYTTIKLIAAAWQIFLWIFWLHTNRKGAMAMMYYDRISLMAG